MESSTLRLDSVKDRLNRHFETDDQIDTIEPFMNSLLDGTIQVEK